MQPPSKSRIWANQDSVVTKSPDGRALSPPLQVMVEGKNNNDYENVPKKLTKARMTEEVGGRLPLISKSTSSAEVSTSMNPIVDEVLQLPVCAPPPSDEDWLRSHTSRLLDIIKYDDALVSTTELGQDEEKGAERADISESLMNNVKDPSVQADEERKSGCSTSVKPWDPRNDTSNTSGRLFVRNLSYIATEEDLKRHLESNGPTSIIEVS